MLKTQKRPSFDVCEITLNVSDRGIGKPVAILHSPTKNSMQLTISPGTNTFSMRYLFWEGTRTDKPTTTPLIGLPGSTRTQSNLKKNTLYSAQCWAFFESSAPTNLALGIPSDISTLRTLDDHCLLYTSPSPRD